MNDKHIFMEQRNLTTRISGFVARSTEPINQASRYNELLRNEIFSIAPVTDRVCDHVNTLISAAQHRASCGDNYNCDLLINNAVRIMRERDYHDKRIWRSVGKTE